MTSQSSQAVLAFVPVIHKGYLDFFRSQKGDVYIFGNKLINEYVHLTRDLRLIEPEETKSILRALLPDRVVEIAEPTSFSSWKYSKIILPDDEVCRDLALRYFPKLNIEFVSVFLRWNKLITFKELEISPDRKITNDLFHKEMIEKAFAEAAKSDDWWRQIGAVALKDKKIVLSSYNRHLPTEFHQSTNGDPRSNFDAGQHQDIFTSIHAEAGLIAQAAREGISLKGTALYSTTFPCPNCARLIGTAGVKTVYYKKGYSLLDAEKILEHFGVEIVLVE